MLLGHARKMHEVDAGLLRDLGEPKGAGRLGLCRIRSRRDEVRASHAPDAHYDEILADRREPRGQESLVDRNHPVAAENESEQDQRGGPGTRAETPDDEPGARPLGEEVSPRPISRSDRTQLIATPLRSGIGSGRRDGRRAMRSRPQGGITSVGRATEPGRAEPPGGRQARAGLLEIRVKGERRLEASVGE